MEDITRAQLIETIRTARAIIDTAWPEKGGLLQTDQRIGESMVRAQVGVVVVGYLLQTMQGAPEPPSQLESLEAPLTHLVQSLQDGTDSNRDLVKYVKDMIDKFQGAISAIEALHQLIMESPALAPPPAEVPQDTQP